MVYCQKLDAHRHNPPNTEFCQKCKREGIERHKCDLWKKEYVTGKDLENAFKENCPDPSKRGDRWCWNCPYYRIYSSGKSYYGEPYEFRRCEFTIEEYLKDILKFRLLPDAIKIIDKNEAILEQNIDLYIKKGKENVKEKKQFIIQLKELRKQGE